MSDGTLDADHLVSGGHGAPRSFSTELAKVLDAAITHGERKKIFGENFRRMAKCIFIRKRLEIDIIFPVIVEGIYSGS